MALRLAGEEFSVLQGLDALGWLREVVANDGEPGLRIDQQGAGDIVDFQDGGTSAFKIGDGGPAILGVVLDVRQPLKNTGSVNGGAVAVDDTFAVIGGNNLRLDNASGEGVLYGDPSKNTWIVKERDAHVSDGNVAEDLAYLYVYNDGAGTRQFVIKYKDGGTVYTGTVSLT